MKFVYKLRAVRMCTRECFLSFSRANLLLVGWEFVERDADLSLHFFVDYFGLLGRRFDERLHHKRRDTLRAHMS